MAIQPVIQIVIPAYGESPFLHKTLESVCKNTASDTPILVVDDCSSTNQVQLIVEQFKDRVEYFRNNDRLGIADNFNNSILLSRGKYTLILGSDDLLEINLNLVKDEIIKIPYENENVVGIIFDAKVLNKENNLHLKLTDLIKKIIKPVQFRKIKLLNNYKFLLSIAKGDWVYFPAILWNTDLIAKYKFDNRFNSAMDLDIFIKLSFDQLFFLRSKSKLINYRRHSQSASSVNTIENTRFKEELICHKMLFQKAIEQRKYYLALLSIIAFSVRLNAIFSLIFRKQITLKQIIQILIKF